VRIFWIRFLIMDFHFSKFFKKIYCIIFLIKMLSQPRKRIKINGHYYKVRQRSTKKGKKGTIMGKWSPKS
jgi:hypothetical protein